MPTYYEVDGVRYLQTTVLIREDLHARAKKEKWNMSAMLNHAMSERAEKNEIP